MSKLIQISGICGLIFLISCGGKNSVPVINIEGNLRNQKPVFLSEFAKDIRYIPLKSVENHPLYNIMVSDISKDGILVSDMTECLLYDLSGNFISKIGSRGRGPGEYPYVTSASLGSYNKIYIKGLWDLYEYDFDGSILKIHPKTFLLNEVSFISSWIIFHDSLIFGHIPNTTGHIINKAIIMNPEGRILHSFQNYDLFSRSQDNLGPYEAYADLYFFKSKLYYKSLYSDTLFYLSDSLKLIPQAAFHIGKYKEPLSERKKKSIEIDRFKYIYVRNVFQTNGYLFIDCNFGYHFTAQRLTPEHSPFGPSLYNTRNILGIFNKETGELVFSQPSRTNNKLYTTGLFNDIDCGPKFYPDKILNDSTMVMFISTQDFKDHVSSIEFRQNTPNNIQKKSDIEELARKIDYTYEQILMLVYFKN